MKFSTNPGDDGNVASHDIGAKFANEIISTTLIGGAIPTSDGIGARTAIEIF